MKSAQPRNGHLAWRWLGRVSFPDAERLQQTMERDRAVGTIADTLLLLEHPHVYTLGRSADHADILLDQRERKRLAIGVHRTDRGGKVTYHGPGQLIGYLIMDLKRRRLSVPRFVWSVEEGLRLWMEALGLSVERKSGCPGLWYQGKKVVSLGFHIRGGISRHGFAVNIQPDLQFFDGIVPCGAKLPVTSLAVQLNKSFVLESCAADVYRQLDSVFSRSSDSSCSDSPVVTDASSAVSILSCSAGDAFVSSS